MEKYCFLKGKKLLGLPAIDWDNFFQRVYITYLDCGAKPNIQNGIINIPLRPFFETKVWEFSHLGNAHILYFQSSQTRQSCFNQISNLANLVKGDLVIFDRLKQKKFHFFTGLKLLLLYMPLWFITINKCKLSLGIKLEMFSVLTHIYYLNKKIKNLDINKYNALVTFYDSFSYEPFMVEIFKLAGKRTFTCMHGQFVAFREPTLINCGLEFRCSFSDVMLCWNQFSVDEGIKQGLPQAKLKPCGIIGNIGLKRETCQKPNNSSFGVVIGHKFFENENIKLIESANLLAKAKGYKFYLKLHPNYKEDYFDSYVDKDCCLGIVKRGVDILDYANMVEFSIVGSSSVFIELIFVDHDVIRYSSQQIDDKFRDIKVGNYFIEKEEIVEVFETMKKKKNDDNAKLFKYLCHSENTSDCYKAMLEQFS